MEGQIELFFHHQGFVMSWPPLINKTVIPPANIWRTGNTSEKASQGGNLVTTFDTMNAWSSHGTPILADHYMQSMTELSITASQVRGLLSTNERHY
jgi:hypothetical protein